jgi:hypothetical protein
MHPASSKQQCRHESCVSPRALLKEWGKSRCWGVQQLAQVCPPRTGQFPHRCARPGINKIGLSCSIPFVRTHPRTAAFPFSRACGSRRGHRRPAPTSKKSPSPLGDGLG